MVKIPILERKILLPGSEEKGNVLCSASGYSDFKH